MYVDPTKRMCPGCPKDNNVHRIFQFAKRESPEGMLYSDLCRDCMTEQRKQINATKETDAVTTLTKSISQIVKRKAFAGPSLGGAITAICEEGGGVDATFGLAGKVFHRALKRGEISEDPDDIDRAVKVGEVILKSVASSEKLKGPPIDLNDLNEEQTADLIAEIVLTNDGVRQRLFCDGEIRRLFLAEVGVEVVDAQTVPSDVEDEQWE